MRRLLISVLVLGLTLEPGSALAEDEGSNPTGAFAAAGKTKVGRFGHAATVLPDGRVLVVGGDTGADGGPTMTAELWDPESLGFGEAGQMKDGRMLATAALLDDGRVLVVGGHGSDGVLRTAEVWDPQSGTFASAGKLEQARFGAEAVTLRDGSVAIIGGGEDVTTVETWHPQDARFRRAGELARPLWGHTVTLLPDGRLLIIGGQRTAHIWDPSTGAVVESGSMESERSHHTATLLADGRVLVIGGSTTDKAIATAEMWDPATQSFGPTGSMAEPRDSHTATPLPGGRVLIAGGQDADGTQLATTEIWDPRTGQFTPSAPLAHARAQHSATPLPDGRILVVGGTGSEPYLRAAELWDPAAVYEAPAPPPNLSLAACAGDRSDPAISALLADFPATLEGVEVEPVACRGRDWLAMHDPSDPLSAATIERAEALLESLGGSVDDLLIAAALHQPIPGQISTITALRADGVWADRLVDPAITLLLGIERPVKATRMVGTTDIETIQVRDETMPGAYPTTLYSPLGDTLWLVTAHERELLGEIVEALPGPGGVVVMPEVGVSITFPDHWQVDVGPERVGSAGFDRDATEWIVAGGGSRDGGGSCSLRVYRPTELTPREVIDRLISGGDEEPLEPEELEGGMVRIAGPGSFLGGDTDMGIYSTGSDHAIAMLFCMASEAPADLWLPVAESIEFIPVDEASADAGSEPTPEPTVLEE